ncbi:MAG: hypothetical protein KBS99_06195 [Prevotellaceae bacterium]|nr:hypothetical protein [Candidatus Colivivens caballi]
MTRQRVNSQNKEKNEPQNEVGAASGKTGDDMSYFMLVASPIYIIIRSTI